MDPWPQYEGQNYKIYRKETTEEKPLGDKLYNSEIVRQNNPIKKGKDTGT